jgi:hypothetical protein
MIKYMKSFQFKMVEEIIIIMVNNLDSQNN